MRKDISPDMYNYNKYPGPQFVSFDTIVKADDIQLTILENHKEAFRADVFSQRFSEILLKYDFIVGDWGNDQLRLRGFFKDDKVAKTNSRISRLDDYLKEYCNFGCAYFVLENPEPRELPVEEEEKRPRRRRDNRKKKGRSDQPQIKTKSKNSKFKQEARKRQEKAQRQENQREIREAKQHFTIRKKTKD